MRKVAIIGSSIAGSCLAYLLARSGCCVDVFEQKSWFETGRKVCSNIVSSDFVRVARSLGIDEKEVIKNKFTKAIFFSQKNSAEFPVEDYEIDRVKLLRLLMEKARGAGAKFHFNIEFLSLGKTDNHYGIMLKRNKKIVTQEADYVIGADGAVSRVAERIGLKNKKRFWLATQAKVDKMPGSRQRSRYFIFFGSRFGYYSYIYPSQDYFTIGTLSPIKQKGKFDGFLEYLKIKEIGKREAALIPIYNPLMRFRKGNIFLIGDAAAMTKFTGGGIMPALRAALWVRNSILGRRSNTLLKLRQELLLHHLIYRGLRKFSDADFDKYLELAKEEGILSELGSRENTREWVFKLAKRKPGLIKLLPKLI